MAQDASNDLVYFLEIETANQEALGSIRHWGNLKAGFEESRILVKGFDFAQINSAEVKSIPFKKLYSSKANKLYLLNSLLPEKNIPSLLWTAIERALPIKLPSFNHNYFGLADHKLKIELKPSAAEFKVCAMLATIADLKSYIETAPAIRLQHLKWTILNDNKVFISGSPIFPIKGEVFWQDDDFFIPAGFEFDLNILKTSLNTKLNSNKNSWVVWNKESSCFLIDKKLLAPLSLSSFRLSFK